MTEKQDRSDLIRELLNQDELDKITSEEERLHLLLEKTVSEDVNSVNQDRLTVGQRISDKVASVAGSWSFIIGFIVILALWIALNSIALWNHADPYPYILLNLILSCIAALQAPIIMMSQNRQDAKDRMRSENDYKVNLKAEIILEDLHRKIDTLLLNQVDLKKSISVLESQADSPVQK